MNQVRFVRNGIILVLLLFAFALRVYKVNSVPLSLDEILTISRYVPLSVVDIFATHHSNNQPLASVLAHLFSPQADHLFLMRWPMIMIGVLTLLFVYRLGTEIFDRKVGILALFLLSISPIHLVYSMVVRGYAGLILLTTISLLLSIRALQNNRWAEWFGFAVVNVLIIYFHMFGMLAATIQLGLIGIWLVWACSRANQPHSFIGGESIRARFVKFGIVLLSLAILYPLLINVQTSAVLSEGGHPGEFEVWRNGLSWPEDISPFVILLKRMALMSPGGIAAYIYLIFGIIGLISLWRRYQMLAIVVLFWLLIPFLAIFVAMQLFGTAFYAYARFLLYLLPSFLILVAAGMIALVDWLLALTKGHSRQWQLGGKAILGSFSVAFLALVVLSLHWHFLRSTPINWPGLADFLSSQLQPGDIAICEERQRGFDIPDRAKPYCIWMLEFFVPELTGYSSNFQSTTDFIANYDYLQEHRAALLEPGDVWLVIWQKLEHNPSHLVTDEKPIIMPVPPRSVIAPYQAWYFGSAILVRVNSEETLLGNIHKAVELLLQVEDSPADRARYYRSLSELEAVQGHKDQANKFFQESRAAVNRAGGQYAELFLADTLSVLNRLPENDVPPETASPVGYQFGSSLCLESYEVSPTTLEAGQPLSLTLYWKALDFIGENYTFFLRLAGESGLSQPGRIEFQPFDGIYPTPWWWAGQRLVEQRQFVIPTNLPGEDYTVKLGAYDRLSPNNEEVIPLFLMFHRSDGANSTHWDVEMITRSNPGCPRL